MKTIIQAICWVLVFVFAPLYIEAQEGERILLKVVKHGGWAVPGRGEFTGVLKERDYQDSGVTVHIKSYSVEPELFTELEAYSIGKGGELRTAANSCVVEEFESYWVGGKAFAYIVRFRYASRDKDGDRHYTFANSWMAYVDEDGNGDYETRYDISSSRGVLKLPGWVTAAGAKASSNNSFNRSGMSTAVIVNLDASRRYFPPG
jgi:hypothetical protein